MKLAFAKLVASVFTVTLFTGISIGAESATGNWKWAITTQNGDRFESTAKLKQEAKN